MNFKNYGRKISTKSMYIYWRANFKGNTILENGQMRQALICLYLYLLKGVKKMFIRCLLLGLLFIVIIFILYVLLPKLKLQHRLHKELQTKKQRQKAFKNKMKELEIK